MRPPVVVFALLLALVGCQTYQLAKMTSRTAATGGDIYTQEILDNFAAIVNDPDTMTFFSLLNQGQTQIQQKGTFDWIMNWDYTLVGTTAGKTARFVNHLDKKTITLNASQQNIENWSLEAVRNPDELQLMRCAYRRALGMTDENDCEKRLHQFFKHNEARFHATDPGWLGVGRHCDVPKDACWVTHCGHAYVWVDPGNLGRLTDFTLAILDIGTAADTAVLSHPDLVANKSKLDELKNLTTMYMNLGKLIGNLADEEKKHPDKPASAPAPPGPPPELFPPPANCEKMQTIQDERSCLLRAQARLKERIQDIPLNPIPANPCSDKPAQGEKAMNAASASQTADEFRFAIPKFRMPTIPPNAPGILPGF